MKEITLSQGFKALVDDEDYERVIAYNWFYDHGYARGCIDGNKTYLHRFIINAGDDIFIDHIDHDTLNNQKCNLRICSKQENQRNQVKSSVGIHKYKGVSYIDFRWRSGISINNKNLHLGVFDSEEEAASAYDMAALHYFGEFAYTNFDKETYEQEEIDKFILTLETSKKEKTSKFRGVGYYKANNKYRAEINVNKNRYVLGYFDTAEEAAHAYDEKALELLGDKAKLNFPLQKEIV